MIKEKSIIFSTSEETKKKWDEKIDYLEEHSTLLSDWELTFLDSISERRRKDQELSWKQSKKLGEIYDQTYQRVCGRYS